MSDRPYRPGETVPRTGLYDLVGPRGGLHGSRPIRLDKGETFPPTPRPGMGWRSSR